MRDARVHRAAHPAPLGPARLLQVFLNSVTKQGCVASLACKLELMQPCCSVKDRIAYSMIKKAEEAGLISPATTTLVSPGEGCTAVCPGRAPHLGGAGDLIPPRPWHSCCRPRYRSRPHIVCDV
jgi:hypothetical protein